MKINIGPEIFLEGNLDSRISKLMEWANSGTELKWECNFFELLSGCETFKSEDYNDLLKAVKDYMKKLELG